MNRQMVSTKSLKVPAVLGLTILLTSAAKVEAQVQVAPEFRTAPRSLITEKVDRARSVIVGGAVRSDATRMEDLGAVSGSLPIEHLQLALRRPAERQAAFDAQVEALHTPGMSSFHKWLTPQIVGDDFGLSAADVATITSYLEAEGFTVNFVGKSRMFVDFTGTAAQVEHSFATSIHNVRDFDGAVRVAALKEASLPQALMPAIAGILPISNIPVAKPNMKKKVPSVGSEVENGTGVKPLDTVSSNVEYDVGPQDFYTIYNENPLLASSINGTGYTVAVIEETDLATFGDIATFRGLFNIVPGTPLLSVQHGGGGISCTAPGVTSVDEEGEAVLDAEWASSVAPSATLIYMSCASTNATAGIFLSAEALVDANSADTMSLSYGEYEGGAGADAAFIQDLWEQAASQGQTVVVSAGDSGSDTRDQNASRATHGLNVSALSSTNWNVSAGGTDFQDGYNYLKSAGHSSAYGYSTYWNAADSTGRSSAKGYIPEIPWNQTCASSQISYYFSNNATNPNAGCDTTGGRGFVATGGGGGGPSALAANARASWQNGTVFGLPATTAYANRLQPDISFFASAGLWGHGVEYYQSDVSTSVNAAGGTSFVAPQLAGMFALIAQKTGERLGQPNYVLYAMAGKAYGTATFAGTACSAGATSGYDTNDTTAPASSCIFNDIQWGNISQACTGLNDCYIDSGVYGILSTSTSASVPAFSANKGYDMATGLGSVNISNLVNNWQSATRSTTYTPTVALAITSATVATYGTADTLTATVSGTGSYPTGSVTFTATPTVGSVGVAQLLGTAACATGGICIEQAPQSIYPSITANNTQYTITATYSSTNENYVSGAISNAVTVKIAARQTPTTTVQAVTASYGPGVATLTAALSFTGVGAPPTGGMNFSVSGGAVMNGACVGSTSPLTCSVTYPIPTSSYPMGTYNNAISASYPGDANYNGVAAKTATLTVVTGTAPSITFTTGLTQYTMYPSVALTAASNSTGTFSYSVVSGPATLIAPTTVLVNGAGTVTILVTQSAHGLYTNGSKTATFTVKAGSIWVGDSTSDVSTFDLSTGSVITAAPGLNDAGVGTIAFPQAEAFDATGDFWVASSAGVSEFTPSASGPVAVSSTPFSGGGINTPLALAVDGLGNIWVPNVNGTVSELSNTGAAISPSTGYTASGVGASYTNVGGIAIDLSGSVWVTNNADGSVTQLLGAAAPVAPLSTSLATGKTGTRP